MNADRKIIHVLYSGLGGHGNVFFSLAEADKENEFKTIAAFCGVEPLLEEYKVRCGSAGIPFEYFAKKAGIDIGIYRRLAEFFFKRNPSILFLHGSSFILPAIFRKIFNFSTRLIIRDTQAHHLKSKSEWMWLSIALLFSSKVVFLTEESKALVQKKFSYLPVRKKMVVIPNGIDVNVYKPGKKDTQVIAIGMQSRLQTIKDHPTLIRAFQVVKKNLPDYSLKLLIAGDGETRSSLEFLVKELGIEKEVVFTGFLEKNELIGFMQSLDIYVHASFGETMSNSIMQAMACGLPIIASDVWGINNMISNGENGLLYTSAKAEDLALLIENLIKNKHQREVLSASARKFAIEHYSAEQMFARYRQIFTT